MSSIKILVYRFLGPALLIFLAGGSLGLARQQLVIKNVECQIAGSEQACPTELQANFNQLTGQPLLFHDLSAAGNSRPLAGWIAAETRGTLPHTLHITVQPVSVTYVVVDPADVTHALTINAQGQAQNLADATLPKITVTPSMWQTIVESHQVPSPLHQQLTAITTNLTSYPASSMAMVNEEMLVAQFPTVQAVLALDQAERGAAQLALILPQLTQLQEKQPLVEIDLRFKHPIGRSTKTF